MLREKRFTLLIALVGAIWVFILGAKSEVYLGDEPTHYILASTIYETGGRPVYYSDIHASPVAKRPAGSEVLWHSLLAGIWWLWGSESVVLAQLYQAGWYALMVLSTYLLGRALYDERVGLYGGFLMATLPMLSAYSIMLYPDVPAITLSVLCLLMCTKKRFFLAGILMGLAILTKRTCSLLIPGIVLILCLQHGIGLGEVFQEDSLRYKTQQQGWKGFFRDLLFLLGTTLLIITPDLYFREKHFYTAGFVSIDAKPLYYSPDIRPLFIHPESIIFHPDILVKYLGGPALLGLGLYTIRKRYREDTFLWLPILSYIMAFFAVILTLFLSTSYIPYSSCGFTGVLATMVVSRYFSPLYPLLILLAAKGLVSLENKRWKDTVLAVCILQVLVSGLYVYKVRTVPPSIKEAYHFAATITPPGQTFLYPRSDLILHAPHKVLWQSDETMPDLPYLFWKANTQEAKTILKRYNISYILITKDLVVDDSTFHNFCGYPVSFVKKLPGLPYLKLVFSNTGGEIWEVEKSWTLGYKGTEDG